jgi:hypothetical protein
MAAVSLLKPPPGSRSGLKLENLLGLLESSRYTAIVFQGGYDWRGYRNMCYVYKRPRGRGRPLNLEPWVMGADI